MSRYVILVLLNVPIVALGILGALVDFKLKKISWRSFLFQLGLWIVIVVGLAGAEGIYTFLFSRRLTLTEPLSLFDVIQITGIIYLLYIANRLRVRAETIERRVEAMHQEISIVLSEPKPKRR